MSITPKVSRLLKGGADVWGMEECEILIPISIASIWFMVCNILHGTACFQCNVLYSNSTSKQVMWFPFIKLKISFSKNIWCSSTAIFVSFFRLGYVDLEMFCYDKLIVFFFG